MLFALEAASAYRLFVATSDITLLPEVTVESILLFLLLLLRHCSSQSKVASTKQSGGSTGVNVVLEASLHLVEVFHLHF